MMKVYAINVLKICILILIILFSFTVTNYPNAAVLNILKDDDLPRIFPDECVRTEMRETTGGEVITSWITCLKKNSFIGTAFTKDGWEAANGRAISSILRQYPDAAYLDVGSNIGPFTVMAAKFTNRAFAVDPSIENLAFLRKSLELEGTQKNVVLINNVVSNETVKLFPYQPDPMNSGWTYFVKEGEIKGRKNYATGKPLMSVTFQQILDIIPDQTIILKIDVEASECKVLTDYLQKEDKEKNIPFIFMEWKHVQVNSENLCPDLEPFVQSFLKAGYSPMMAGPISSLKQIQISHLRRNEIEIPDVLWIHKQALTKLGYTPQIIDKFVSTFI